MFYKIVNINFKFFDYVLCVICDVVRIFVIRGDGVVYRSMRRFDDFVCKYLIFVLIVNKI